MRSKVLYVVMSPKSGERCPGGAFVSNSWLTRGAEGESGVHRSTALLADILSIKQYLPESILRSFAFQAAQTYFHFLI